MIARIVFLLVFSNLAGTAVGQAPVAVVERTVTRGDVATRVSLFSNRVVVVAVRRGDVQDFLRRITISEVPYMVYLTALEQSANEVGEKPVSSQVRTPDAKVVLSLHIGPDSPRTIIFSPMSSVDLPLARIMGALDDLELQVFEASPSAEAMRVWEPKRGDRVELLNGALATVVEVWDDGLLILEHEQTYVRESIGPGTRDQVILRVLDSER